MSKFELNMVPVRTVLAVTAGLPVQNPAPAYDLVRHVLAEPKMPLPEVLGYLQLARYEILKQNPHLAPIKFPEDRISYTTDGNERSAIVKAWIPAGANLEGEVEVRPVGNKLKQLQQQLNA